MKKFTATVVERTPNKVVIKLQKITQMIYGALNYMEFGNDEDGWVRINIGWRVSNYKGMPKEEKIDTFFRMKRLDDGDYLLTV